MTDAIEIRMLPGKTAFVQLIKAWMKICKARHLCTDENKDATIETNIRQKDLSWISLVISLLGGTMFRKEGTDKKDIEKEMVSVSIYPKRI